MSAVADLAGAPRPRPAAARFHARADGIDAVEAFSRGDALDRDWMGWGALRVLSRQEWAPGAARDEGRVANMERLLLVLDGALAADCGDLGRHRIEAGGALWIGAGHGMTSRLANASATVPLRLVELWLQPDRVNAVPAVAVRGPDASAAADTGAVWTAMALPLRQRARAMVARMEPGETPGFPSAGGARYWLEVLEGEVAAIPDDTGDAGAGTGAHDATLPVTAPAMHLGAGDGVAWCNGDTGAPASVAASGPGPAHVLLLELPA